MALPHVNAIGAFQFIALDGSVRGPEQRVEVWERNGLDGIGLRKAGVKGAPFQLISTNFVAPDAPKSAFQVAKELLDTYRTAVGAGAQTLTRFSVDEGEFSVLSVQENQPPTAVVNALVADIFFEVDAVLQVLNWTLVAE